MGEYFRKTTLLVPVLKVFRMRGRQCGFSVGVSWKESIKSGNNNLAFLLKSENKLKMLFGTFLRHLRTYWLETT